MKKILVTGGAGFIGSQLVKSYVQQGNQVIILDSLSATTNHHFSSGNVKQYQCDIADAEQVFAIIHAEKPQIINHHAAQVDINRSMANPIQEVEVAVNGITNLLAATTGYQLEKCIFASSGGALYEDSELPATEDSSIAAQTPYGLAKLEVEKYIQSYAGSNDIPYVILRYANVYGPGQLVSRKGIIALMINSVFSQGPLVIYGDGKQNRDFVFVDDAIRANMLASQKDVQGIFNISSGKAVCINQLLHMIESELGLTTQLSYKKSREYEKKYSCLSFEKASKELSWKPQVSLKQGIQKMIEAQKSISA